MELEQMRQLEAIDRYGTMSAAAEHLHLTQPSLSRSMKRLETDLGQELFDRTGNSAVFNEAGRLALEHARALLAEEQRMRDDFDELARRQRTIKVVSVAPAPVWRLTGMVVQRFPGVILQTELVSRQQAESALINLDADLSVTLHPLQLPNMSSVPLITEDLYLSAPKNSPLAARESVSFKDLDGQTFLVFEQIGFWMDVTREQLPHAQIIVQNDRNVFMQLAMSSDLLCFATDVPENDPVTTKRTQIPIVDASAHATFFLNARKDAPDQIRQIVELVASQPV